MKIEISAQTVLSLTPMKQRGAHILMRAMNEDQKTWTTALHIVKETLEESGCRSTEVRLGVQGAMETLYLEGFINEFDLEETFQYG